MKVLVVTSYTAAAEPRAVRNALAARRAFPDAEIVFLDRVVRGQVAPDPASFASHGITRAPLDLATKRSDPLKRTLNLFQTKLALFRFRLGGTPGEALFGPTAIGLQREIRRRRPDLVIAHTIQTLPAALDYCRRTGAPLIFDVFEYYSDMGDAQTAIEGEAAKAVEKGAYRRTALLLTTSELMAEILRQEYGAESILVSLNVPPLEPASAPRAGGGLKLYWRNSQVALSQRGLGDALQSMPDVPADVELFVQGRPSKDIDHIREIIARLGVEGRVHILPPFKVGKAVEAARDFDVGLCLERPGPCNHQLTISNKFFDYHMAGLAVISSDMPSLATALKRTGGGLTYRAGSVADLAKAIRTLHGDRERLNACRAAARRFAEERGNLEFEIKQVSAAFRAAATRSAGGNEPAQGAAA